MKSKIILIIFFGIFPFSLSAQKPDKEPEIKYATDQSETLSLEGEGHKQVIKRMKIEKPVLPLQRIEFKRLTEGESVQTGGEPIISAEASKLKELKNAEISGDFDPEKHGSK